MRNILFVLAMSVLMFTASCGKKDGTVNTTATVYSTYASMNDVYQPLALSPKYVTINALNTDTVFGNSGTRYIFPSTCFQDGSGAIVMGNVQVALTEYLKKGDMIFSKVLPLSDGTHLISGGEILANATQNGQPVYLRPGYTFEATVPASVRDTSMIFFRGRTVANPTTNMVNWQPQDSLGRGLVIYNGDTINIFSDSLGFANADRFLSSPNYQSFTVNISLPGALSISSLSEVAGFALYDNYKGVWPLNGYGNGTFSEHYVPDVPVHFAVLGLINGHFYAGVTGATPHTGGTYTVPLTEVKPEDFKAQLNSLYQ